jgi:hypothetical protein
VIAIAVDVKSVAPAPGQEIAGKNVLGPHREKLLPDVKTRVTLDGDLHKTLLEPMAGEHL